MSPTIRIDEEVYQWLQGQAVPLEDTPNSVLRRVAGLDGNQDDKGEGAASINQNYKKSSRFKTTKRSPMANGRELISRWKLDVQQARFHRDGHYFEHLTKFPAALCDPNGYVIFADETEYRMCPYLKLGQQVNVDLPGISVMPNYLKVDDPIRE